MENYDDTMVPLKQCLDTIIHQSLNCIAMNKYYFQQKHNVTLIVFALGLMDLMHRYVQSN